MFRRLLLIALMAVAWPAAAQPAATQSEQQRVDEARASFKKGAALAREDRWTEALEAFEASAALLEHAGTTYNMGYCERGLGHLTRARRWFARALQQDKARGGELSDAQRAAAADYLREAEAGLARVTVTVDIATAAIAVDGRPLERERDGVMVAGTRPLGAGEPAPALEFELLVDPGEHTIELSEGKRVERKVVALGSGELRALTLSLPAPTADATEHAAIEDGGLAPQQGWAIGMAGVGVALGVAGGVLAGVAANSWSDAKDVCPELDSCPTNEGYELANQAGFEARLSTAAFVTAAAALTGAAVLWLTAPDDDVAVGVTPRGVRLVGTF